MIPRYTRETMGKIWKPKSKFNIWLKTELLVCEALAEKGVIPLQALENIRKKARFSVRRIEEIEKVVKHDVIAFLENVAEYVGPDSRFIHMGLTSSDVLDTGFALQLKEAMELMAEPARAGHAAAEPGVVQLSFPKFSQPIHDFALPLWKMPR